MGNAVFYQDPNDRLKPASALQPVQAPTSVNPYQSGVNALMSGIKQQKAISNAVRSTAAPALQMRAQQPDMLSRIQQEGPWSEMLTKASIAQQQAASERADQMARLRNRRSGYSDLTFNRLANPFGADNPYLKGLNASSVGQAYGQMGDALKNLREDMALRGITQDSGLAQSQELGARQGAAGQVSQMLNENANQNYRLGAQFDQDQAAAERAFNTQKASAMDNFDFNALDRLRSLNQDQQAAASQNPLDQLRIMQGQSELDRYRQMTPLELEGARLNNAGQGIRNTAGQYGLDFTRATQPGSIAFTDAQNRYGTQNANYAGNMLNDEYDYHRRNKPMLDMMRNWQMQSAMQQGAMDNFVNFSPFGTMGRFFNNPNVKGLFQTGMQVAPMFMGAPSFGGAPSFRGSSGFA